MENKQKNLHHCTYADCNSAFNRPYRLAQHLLVHKNIKAFKCKESNCSKSYTNKSHLDRHINAVHKNECGDDMLFSCPICLKRYSNRQNLKRHIKLHKLKTTFSCHLCKLEFNKKHQLSAHMYQHTGIKSFSCEICLKEFSNLREKKQHSRTHKTYSCEECLMKFNQWSKYQKHKNTNHADKDFICNECSRHFKKRIHIVRHIRSHMKAQPKSYACTYDNCNRIYSRNSNLKQHILIKHERITHGCGICGAELCTKAKLILHLKRHSEPLQMKPPKTKISGRKERKDVGSLKVSTAQKLAGIPQTYEPEIINVAF